MKIKAWMRRQENRYWGPIISLTMAAASLPVKMYPFFWYNLVLGLSNSYFVWERRKKAKNKIIENSFQSF